MAEEEEREERPVVELELLRERVGRVLRDKWTLEKLLGVGGMAAVYAAKHEDLGRRDAVKILHPAIARDESVTKRFRREAKVVQRFKHPGVVEVLDFDVSDDGEPFLVMELLDGASLARHLKRDGPMDAEALLPVVIDMLDALAAAHAEGIVHRDIKPSNVMITKDGAVKVLDFGVARWARASATLVTAAGTTVGTVAYMPPEQLRSSSVDHRADIYAVGATMVRMLTGEHVHVVEDEAELSRAILTEPAPPMADRIPDADENLCLVIDRALAHRLDRRYPDARTMQRDLEAVVAGEAPPFATHRREAGDDPRSLEALDEVEPPTSSTTRPDRRTSDEAHADAEPELDDEAPTAVMADAEEGGTVPMHDAADATLPSAPPPPASDDEPETAPTETTSSPPPAGATPTPDPPVADGASTPPPPRATSPRDDRSGGAWWWWALAAGVVVAGGWMATRSDEGPPLPPPVELGAPPEAPSEGADPQEAEAEPAEGPAEPAAADAPDDPAVPGTKPPPPAPGASGLPSSLPSGFPSSLPSSLPSGFPSSLPSSLPTALPSSLPSSIPTALPTTVPTAIPTEVPTALPSGFPSWDPTVPEAVKGEASTP